MADAPFPLESDKLDELKPQIVDTLRDIYENRLGGCTLGDVFELSGDTFQLKIKPGCGLIKENGQLSVDPTLLGTDATFISNTPAGNISSTTVQGAINELDTEKVGQGAEIATFKYIFLKAMPRPSGEAGYCIIYLDESDYSLYVVWTDGTRTKLAPP